MPGKATGESGPGEPEGLAAAARKARSLGQGYFLLIAMFFTAIGGLYLLSRWKGPDKASAEVRTTELQVDDALGRMGLQGQLSRHTDVKSLVDGFYGQAAERQIALDALGRNPFVYDEPMRMAPVGPVKPVKEPSPTKVRADQRTQDIVREVQALKLQVVLVGEEQNSAIISNNLLTVGQEIRGWTVAVIEPRRVVLKHKQYTHELKLPK